MQITSGLLISLAHGAAADRVRESLSSRPGVFPGEPEGRWQPAAIEAGSEAELRELHDWIAGLPGVAHVDVVHVNFGDPPATPDPTRT